MITTELPDRPRHAERAPPHRRGADRRAGRDPRRRLAGVRAGGLRQADRLPRAPAAPLRRAVGAQQDARARRCSTSVTRVAGRAHARSPAPATIVHGDYRLGNVMFAPGAPARLSAIFDWELATIGDPLADVGYLRRHLGAARRPRERDLRARRRSRASPGFPTRDELIARYEERSGPLDVRRALVHDAGAVEVGGLPRGLLQAPAGRHDRRPVLRPARARACPRSPTARGRSRMATERSRRAARRLRRRPHHRRLRVVRRLLPRRGARRPTRCATASATTRRRATCSATSRTGKLDRRRVRAALRRVLGVERPEGLIDRLFARHAARTRRCSTPCAPRARAGIRTGLVSNSWGEEPLRPRALRRAVRRRRDLRRGRDPQARRRRSTRWPPSGSSCRPSACVFVDDLPGNLKPARGARDGDGAAPRRRRRRSPSSRRCSASACADRRPRRPAPARRPPPGRGATRSASTTRASTTVTAG